jgi:hypothetical protein
MSQEFFHLWEQLVPQSGQADTVQGELIRAIGRMDDEVASNGFANWDSGYERLSDFALRCLTDGTFGPQTTAGIRTDIEHIQTYARGGNKNEYNLEADFDRLMQAVVGWCQRHPDKIPRNMDPDLKRYAENISGSAGKLITN